jgi:predicted negative regulator of RcsB-dependent stress response
MLADDHLACKIKRKRGSMGEVINRRNFKLSVGKKKLVKFSVLTVLILGLIVGGGFLANYQYYKNRKCNSKADNPLYKEAASVMTQTKYRELEQVVNKIKKQHNYLSDADCIYPVVEYYVIVGDIPKANEAFGQLERVYNKQKGLSKVYAATASTIDDVKAQLKQLDSVNEQFNKKRQYFD